jgi:hypothetical protein
MEFQASRQKILAWGFFGRGAQGAMPSTTLQAFHGAFDYLELFFDRCGCCFSYFLQEACRRQPLPLDGDALAYFGARIQNTQPLIRR